MLKFLPPISSCCREFCVSFQSSSETFVFSVVWDWCNSTATACSVAVGWECWLYMDGDDTLFYVSSHFPPCLKVYVSFQKAFMFSSFQLYGIICFFPWEWAQLSQYFHLYNCLVFSFHFHLLKELWWVWWRYQFFFF